MSWRHVSEFGGSPRMQCGLYRDTLLTKGTLLVEARIGTMLSAPLDLLDYHHDHGWDRSLTITLHPDGGVVLEDRQGPSVVSGRLVLPADDRMRTLRVLYSWDAPLRRGTLSVEVPLADHWARITLDATHPIPAEDLERLSLLPPPSRATTLVAWADTVEPVGPMPGLGTGTPLRTALGWKPVEEIEPGDLVQTSATGFQPVRHVISRETPAVGHYAPLMLAAPSFGLLGDVLISPDLKMLIEGADADYLFGVDAVLVEARHLTGLAAMWPDRRLRTVTYHQVVLDHHACVSIAGAWGESQFLPRLAGRSGELVGTILDGIAPAKLPSHDEAANPIMRAYEAVVLVSAIRA